MFAHNYICTYTFMDVYKYYVLVSHLYHWEITAEDDAKYPFYQTIPTVAPTFP